MAIFILRTLSTTKIIIIFFFLDWRQDFGGNLKVGDIYYDLAKLLHGMIVNHEIIINKKFFISWSKKEIKIKISKKKNMKECINYFEQWLFTNKLNKKKVYILTSLIYLNIASLHHFPYSLFLYGLGKKMLKESLDINDYF